MSKKCADDECINIVSFQGGSIAIMLYIQACAVSAGRWKEFDSSSDYAIWAAYRDHARSAFADALSMRYQEGKVWDFKGTSRAGQGFSPPFNIKMGVLDCLRH